MRVQSTIQILFLLGALAAARAISAQALESEPRVDAGQSITGVFEGWFKNPDGSFSFLLGYYNRNLKGELDIPVGPNNRIQPGGPDRGQPSHFLPGRMWGDFTVTVPKDFGSEKLTWTIAANGKTTVIPMSLKTDWEISPFIDATDNTPPTLSFEGFDNPAAMVQGPRPLVTSMVTTVGRPLDLTVWAADDAKVSPGTRVPKVPVSITWSMFRGPGCATFSNAKPVVEKVEGKMPPKATFAGKATTQVTFSDPGEYELQVTANDATGEGGGGFQCCWTNAHVKVSVVPETTGSR